MTEVGRLVVGAFNESEEGMFGLRIGQERNNCLVMDAGWYNVAGERIGHGDLDPLDLQAIADELAEEEVFIVLLKVSGVEVIETVDLASRAQYVVRRGQCIFVTERSDPRDPMNCSGILITFRGRAGIEDMLR